MFGDWVASWSMTWHWECGLGKDGIGWLGKQHRERMESMLLIAEQNLRLILDLWSKWEEEQERVVIDIFFLEDEFLLVNLDHTWH